MADSSHKMAARRAARARVRRTRKKIRIVDTKYVFYYSDLVCRFWEDNFETGENNIVVATDGLPLRFKRYRTTRAHETADCIVLFGPHARRVVRKLSRKWKPRDKWTTYKLRCNIHNLDCVYGHYRRQNGKYYFPKGAIVRPCKRGILFTISGNNNTYEAQTELVIALLRDH